MTMVDFQVKPDFQEICPNLYSVYGVGDLLSMRNAD